MIFKNNQPNRAIDTHNFDLFLKLIFIFTCHFHISRKDKNKFPPITLNINYLFPKSSLKT